MSFGCNPSEKIERGDAKLIVNFATLTCENKDKFNVKWPTPSKGDLLTKLYIIWGYIAGVVESLAR